MDLLQHNNLYGRCPPCVLGLSNSDVIPKSCPGTQNHNLTVLERVTGDGRPSQITEDLFPL